MPRSSTNLKKTVREIEELRPVGPLPRRPRAGGHQSLAAIQEGARQVECTINGIGERAGTPRWRRWSWPLHTRRDYGLTTGISTRHLYPVSRKLSHITGIHVQRNKAIVGQNAFAHEAGIHQDGMLKNSATYWIMDPGSAS